MPVGLCFAGAVSKWEGSVGKGNPEWLAAHVTSKMF